MTFNLPRGWGCGVHSQESDSNKKCKGHSSCRLATNIGVRGLGGVLEKNLVAGNVRDQKCATEFMCFCFEGDGYIHIQYLSPSPSPQPFRLPAASKCVPLTAVRSRTGTSAVKGAQSPTLTYFITTAIFEGPSETQGLSKML